MGSGWNHTGAVVAAITVALALPALDVAGASGSTRPCALAATTLRPTHVTTMSAVMRGRVTTCGAHGVTAWFAVNGHGGNSFSVKAAPRTRTERELLVDLRAHEHVTYRFVVQRGHKVVSGRTVRFTAP